MESLDYGKGELQAHGLDTSSSDVVSGYALQSLSHGPAGVGLPQNAHVPSHSSTGERISYLNRPLPPAPSNLSLSPPPRPPPPPLAVAMASSRPSTSAGLSSHPPGRNDFNKRMSKDDMFFSNVRQPQASFDKRISRDDMYIKSRMAQMASFHVPVNGLAPTPEHSPNSNPIYPPSHDFSVPARINTPESMMSGEIQIGMALGSPTHPPDSHNRWQAQFPPATPALASSEPSPAVVEPTGESLQRKKTGRRKLFGLFGKRKEVEIPAVSQHEAAPMVSSSSSASVTSESRAPMPRSNTQADRAVLKHKPMMIRSNTAPYITGDAAASQASLKPPSKSKARKGQQQLPPQLQVPNSQKANLLDVEIPSIKLDRYSVMFGSVLNQEQSQPAATLLARRQATLDKLKTINDKIELEEAEKVRTRRATSPQPTASPSFPLFPMPPSGRESPSGGRGTPTSTQKGTSLLRSNTSPGNLPSPSRPTFAPEDRSQAKGHSNGDSLSIPSQHGHDRHQKSPAHSPARVEQEPIYPTDNGFRFGPEHSNFILESPTSMTDTEEPKEIIISQPFKPAFQEPQWEMISPSSTSILSSSSMSASDRKRSAPTTSSAHSHMTRPSADQLTDEAEAALRSAVEVSIARQISVSRQQRHLLRPLQTSRGKIPVPGGAASPVSKLGKNEPLRSTPVSTPTLINPRVSPVNSQELAQNRKSSWAVIDEA